MTTGLSTEHGLRRSGGLQLALFQKRLPGFRTPVFGRLALEPGVNLTVVVAEKPTNLGELPFDCRVIPGRSISIGDSHLVLQPGFLREARRHDVLLVEGSVGFLTSVGAVAAKSRHRAAVVWWTSLHDRKSQSVAMPGGPKGVFLRQVLKGVDGVVTYSDSAASVLQSEMPFLPNVVVAPNVLDTDVLLQAEHAWLADRPRLDSFAREKGLQGRLIILFAGRLIPAKRLEDLLLAFELLRRRRADLDPLLAIVGDGPDRKRLQTLADTLRVSEYVKFFGEIREPREVCPFFLHARALLLPGAGGLAIYQALAHGVPVVAARADGTEQDLIREGKSGFLCEPGDVEGLARRTESILELPKDAWRSLSTASSTVAREDFHVRTMIRGIRQAVETAHAARVEAGEVRRKEVAVGGSDERYS